MRISLSSISSRKVFAPDCKPAEGIVVFLCGSYGASQCLAHSAWLFELRRAGPYPNRCLWPRETATYFSAKPFNSDRSF